MAKKLTRVEVYNPTMGWVVMFDNAVVQDGKISLSDFLEAKWTYNHPEQGKITSVVDLSQFPAYTLV